MTHFGTIIIEFNADNPNRAERWKARFVSEAADETITAQGTTLYGVLNNLSLDIGYNMQDRVARQMGETQRRTEGIAKIRRATL